MRTQIFYDNESDRLGIQFPDRPPRPKMDTGQIAGLPGIILYFDPAEAGRLVAVTAHVPFEHRSDEWQGWLSRILGPILDTAREARNNNESFDLTVDFFDPELEPQKVVWSTLHNQLREVQGLPALKPLRTASRLRAIKAALAGARLALVPQATAAAHGAGEGLVAASRTEYPLDPMAAAAAGIEPRVTVERLGDADLLKFTVTDSDSASKIAFRAGTHVQPLSGFREGPAEVQLPPGWDAERSDLSIIFAEASSGRGCAK